ncbi:autophagy protein Apg17-domain-containing protein [Dipodascopsis tothii]|uniref:autophagy protein Apg17-domain-containing protein n=1 Tax=Dipodascopsis tothii TaxID=44089 RepID=UPI0034CE9B74
METTGWFVAAKKALGVASPLCARASALVDETKAAVCHGAARSAAAAFVAREVAGQVDVLVAVADSVQRAIEVAAYEFQDSLTDLDTVGAALAEILDVLGRTTVDAGFGGAAAGGARTLREYTDESAVEALKAQLHGAIDIFQEAHATAADAAAALERDVAGLAGEVEPAPAATGARAGAAAIEAAAEDMGELLDSLTRHYDQCSEALVADERGELDPATAADRAELAVVLAGDAEQVDGVVAELRAQLTEIEATAGDIAAFAAAADRAHARAVARTDAIDDFAHRRLPAHLAAARAFGTACRHYFARRAALLGDLSGLVAYFKMFLQSYDALVLEVLRRQKAHAKMERVVEDAVERLKALHYDEVAARDAFHAERGSFLPSELWTGLADPPLGFEVIANEVSALPELSPATVDAVKKRVLLLDPAEH